MALILPSLLAIGHVGRAIPLLLSSIDPPPKPVILHGDLWSGNVGLDSKTRSPVIFDPACYYGHNEADLGITHMFGGQRLRRSR